MGTEELLQQLVEEKHLGQTAQHTERHSCLSVHGVYLEKLCTVAEAEGQEVVWAK